MVKMVNFILGTFYHNKKAWIYIYKMNYMIGVICHFYKIAKNIPVLALVLSIAHSGFLDTTTETNCAGYIYKIQREY